MATLPNRSARNSDPLRGAPWPGRLIAIAVVALVHAGLLAGLSLRPDRLERGSVAPLQIALLSDTKAEAPTPPPPSPRFEVPAVDLPPPRISIALAAEPYSAITTRPEHKSTSPVAAPPVEVATGTAAPLRVTHVEYVEAPLPRYPAMARKRRQWGTVIVEAIVDVDGRASAVEIRESSGYPLLDSAASEAVRRARFRPYVFNGVVRAVSVLVPIEFSLGGRMASNGSRQPASAAR